MTDLVSPIRMSVPDFIRHLYVDKGHEAIIINDQHEKADFHMIGEHVFPGLQAADAAFVAVEIPRSEQQRLDETIKHAKKDIPSDVNYL